MARLGAYQGYWSGPREKFSIDQAQADGEGEKGEAGKSQQRKF